VLDAKRIKRIQQIVGSILYYARAVDMTVLMALSAIAVEQTQATEKNNGMVHPNARLPRVQLQSKGAISRVRYDNEYTLGCVIPFQNQSALRSLWAFFHGMDAHERGTHPIKWSILCKHNEIMFCGGVSSGS
jgi:hypothetical protein